MRDRQNLYTVKKPSVMHKEHDILYQQQKSPGNLTILPTETANLMTETGLG